MSDWYGELDRLEEKERLAAEYDAREGAQLPAEPVETVEAMIDRWRALGDQRDALHRSIADRMVAECPLFVDAAVRIRPGHLDPRLDDAMGVVRDAWASTQANGIFRLYIAIKVTKRKKPITCPIEYLELI